MTELDVTTKATADNYDGFMYAPLYLEFFAASDFANFGYWDESVRSGKDACEMLMARLLALAPAKQGTVLDVACGKGATTQYLTRHYRPSDITAINISDRQLQTAAAHVPEATFRLMDATRLDFPDNTFDAVVCIEAAFHFNTRERFLREALRVLKPGGILLMSDFLMTLEGERSRFNRHEENFLPDLAAYQALLRHTGFATADVIDVTDQTWGGFYRAYTRLLHDKFYRGEIDIDTLKRNMDIHYERVRFALLYVFVAATKAR